METTQIENEHLFSIENLSRPTFCSLCGDFIWGLTKQGYKCRAFSCNFVVHKKCQSKSPPNCPFTRHSMAKDGDPLVRNKVTSVTDIGVAHVFKEARFNKPTWCGYCGNFVKEVLGKQGFKCTHCKLVIHKKCFSGASNQTCTGVTEGPGETSMPFAEAASALGLSFAEIVIMVDLFESLKGQTITQRDGIKVDDCFTGLELIDLLIQQNSWRRSLCIEFAKSLYLKQIVEPVLHFSSATFEDNGSFYKFSSLTTSEMKKSLEKRNVLREKERKLTIVGNCLAQVEAVKAYLADLEKLIKQNLLLPQEIDAVVIALTSALSKENLEVNFRKSQSNFSEFISKIKVIESKLSRADMSTQEAEQLKTTTENLEKVFDSDSLVKLNNAYPLRKQHDLSWFEKNVHWFKEYYKNQTFVTYYGYLEDKSPVLSLIKLDEKEGNGGAVTFLRGLICTNWGIKKVIISDEQLIDKTIMAKWQNYYNYILQLMAPELTVTELRSLVKPGFSESFMAYEQKDLRVRTHFTTALVLRKKDQNTEQMLANESGSNAYETFLKCIGEIIELQNWAGFKGGLDTIRGTNGVKSIYAKYGNNELMFHVATMMPKDDRIKMLIESDTVVVIFQEEGCDLYDTSLITGEFLRVVIIVQTLPPINGNNYRYRIEVVKLNDDLLAFGPNLSYPPIFTIGNDLHKALLEIILSAHLAAFHSPSFFKLFSQSHTSAVNDLVSSLKKEENILDKSLSNSFKKKPKKSGNLIM